MPKDFRTKCIQLLLSFLILNGFFIKTAFADSPYNDPNQWNFLIAPYGWLPSLNGDVTAKGLNSNFSVPFSEILQNLDFAAELHAEAAYGPWSIMVDPTYIKETGETTINHVNADLTSQVLLIDGGVFYQFASSCFPNGQSLSLEALGGARYLGLDNTIDFTPDATLPNKIVFLKTVTGKSENLGSGLSVSSSTQLIAPILGGRIKYNLSDTSHLWLRADVGGFHVDNVNNTWSTTAGFDYNFTPNFDVGIAYRVLRIDVSQSETSSMDMLIYGPLVGISFEF